MAKDGKHIILIKNIYYMLSYFFMPLKQDSYADVAKEDFEHIHDLFAGILARGIGLQLKQGLYREYIDRVETLAVLRGKLEISGTIKNRLMKKRLLSCEHDELSENNSFNRILKTTALLLLRHGDVNEQRKAGLKKELRYLAKVDTVEPATIRWGAIRFERNNNTYRMLLGICRLVLEGMLLTTEAGGYKLASFFKPEEMAHLYEKFLLEYYVREHPELKAEASEIKWDVDKDTDKRLPEMKTDVTLTKKVGDEERVLIIDAKYYASGILKSHYAKQALSSGNLYQIFTYVKNKDAAFGGAKHRVSGMLLYAQTDEEIQPDNTYIISGNRISVRTLDLNREFKEIRAQLDNIAADHFCSA